MPLSVRTSIPQPTWKMGFARSAGESAYPNLWKGTVGIWSMGLGPTGLSILHDVSSYKNNGTLGSVFVSTDWLLDGGRYSLDFRQLVNQTITLGTDSLLTGLPATHNFTVSFWSKSDTNVDDKAAFSFSGTDDLVIYPNDNSTGSGGLRVFWRDVGTNLINEAGPNLIGKWHHTVFLSRASNDHEGYRDGVSVGTSSSTGTAGPFTDLWIGSFGSGAQWFNGRIDELILYNRALNDSEILQLYNIGRGGIFQRRPITIAKAPAAAAGTRHPLVMGSTNLLRGKL